MPALLVATSEDENVAGGDIVTAEPSTLDVGNVLLGWMSNFSSGTANTPGDISGLTTQFSNTGIIKFRNKVMTRLADGTEGPNYTSSVTAGAGTAYSIGELFQVLDAAGATLDASNTKSGSAVSSATMPAVTSVAARCLAVAIVQCESFAITTVPAGWMLYKEIANSFLRVFVRFLDAAGASTGTTSISFGGATDYTMDVFTIAPAVQRYPSPCGYMVEAGTSLGAANAQPVSATPSRVPVAGDLVVYLIGVDNSGGTAISASTGWTLIDNTTYTGDIIRGAWAARILDGGANDTFSPTGAAQDYACVGTIFPKGTHSCTDVTTLVHGTPATALSTSPDPPSVTATANSLVLVGCVVDMTTGNTVTVVPANYARLATLGANGLKSANSTSSVGVGFACRPIIVAGTENPGVFTCSSQEWIAFTLVIPGAISRVQPEPRRPHLLYR